LEKTDRELVSHLFIIPGRHSRWIVTSEWIHHSSGRAIPVALNLLHSDGNDDVTAADVAGFPTTPEVPVGSRH
jgi:hypothetical protein